jgi:hypothetical protein
VLIRRRKIRTSIKKKKKEAAALATDGNPHLRTFDIANAFHCLAMQIF